MLWTFEGFLSGHRGRAHREGLPGLRPAREHCQFLLLLGSRVEQFGGRPMAIPKYLAAHDVIRRIYDSDLWIAELQSDRRRA